MSYYPPPPPPPPYAPAPPFPPAGGPVMIPQSAVGPSGAYAQQVAGGGFPYLNRVELVGQVFGNDQSTGIRWINGQNGRDGHIEVKFKVRKSWNARNGAPGVKQILLKLVAYGQLGQHLGNQIRPGMMLKVTGELMISNFLSTRGKNQGQWVTDVQVQLRDGQNGQVPFELLGILPVVDERPQRNNYGAPQGGYPQQPGGYGQPNNGGYPGQPSYPPPAPPAGSQPPYAPMAPSAPAYAPPPAPAHSPYGSPASTTYQPPAQPPAPAPNQGGTFMPPNSSVPGAPPAPYQGAPQGAPMGGPNGGIPEEDIPF